MGMINDGQESIYHEFRESEGRRFHRLVQGSEKGKWVTARQFCRLDERLFAAPEGLEGLPEVFYIEAVWATTVQPTPINRGDDKNWTPT